MSMYEMLMQADPFAKPLLLALGIPGNTDKWIMGRFRDCYLNEECDRIVILNRNGGGNRPDHEDSFESLRKHPMYVRDYDDDFDSTYAYVEFKVPDSLDEAGTRVSSADVTARLRAMGAGRKPALVRFRELVERMGSDENKEDEDVKRALDAAKPLMDKLKGALEGGGSGEVIEV